MCTLAIAPEGKEGFKLVSNRDESKERPRATLPQYHFERDHRILMPLDPEGGGSWIALSDEGRAACLLNGARKAHDSQPPYAKSRGQVLKESFEWEDPEAFLYSYPLQDLPPDGLSIEPFTLVLLGNDPEPWIKVLYWNGEEREIEELQADKPHVLSAAKLYSPRILQDTQERFHGYLKGLAAPPALEDLERFIDGERYRLKMEKGGESPLESLDTLSRTSLSFGHEHRWMKFLDIEGELEAEVRMEEKG